MSAVLYCFHEKMLPLEIKKLLQFANEIGAMATTEHGALTSKAMPQKNLKKYQL